MVLKLTAIYEIDESTKIGEARRATAKLATQLGFSEEDGSRAAIIATEMATNLVNHATGSCQFLLQRVDGGSIAGIEMIAIDRGPGIRSMADAQRDGFSTGGSAGQGIGAMRRLANVFDIHSVVGRGTAVLARVYPAKAETPPQNIGVLAVAKPGEEECGDACAWEIRDGHGWFMVADGLGHGPVAAEASSAAVAMFERTSGESAQRRLEQIHGALSHTRGAAVAIAEIGGGGSRQEVCYAGLGNIAGIVAGGRLRNLVSLHGTAGQLQPRITAFPSEWSSGSTLIMHSDGLTTKWEMDRYPGLLSRHPALIAAVLFRDASRGRDDSTVLVYKPIGPDA